MASIRKRSWTTAGGERHERWIADFRDQQGARRHRQFRRRKDADAWLVQARSEVAVGTYTPDSTSITVAEATELWLEHALARGLERATILMMRQNAAHLLPLVGIEKLAKLSRPRVEQLADTLRTRHSLPMARKILQSFRSILLEARRRGLLANDPATGVRIAAGKRHQRRLQVGVDIPTIGELNAILAAALGPRDRAFLALAAHCALRASELRGLAWEQIQLGQCPTVHIVQRADRFGDTPKSATSRRMIPLGEVTVRALREWRLAQPPGRCLVFGSEHDRPQYLPNLYRELLRPALARASVRHYSFHSFRHFAISRWLAAGLDLKLVQQLAGHSMLAMTLDRYGHLIPRHDDHARVAAVEVAT